MSPQHEQHTRTRTLELKGITNTLSGGILDCPRARTSECTRGQGKQRRIPPHEQPRGLERNSRCKNSRARFSPERCLSREPPGYYFGKMLLLPECSSRRLWSNVFSTWIPFRGCTNGGCWTFLVRKRHCTVRNYWSEQFITGNKTEKPSDEPLTE